MSDITYQDLKEKRIVVPLSELVEWEDNPKQPISVEDYNQLKKDVKRKQFKPLIVMPREDGKAVVLGGNHRLKAMREDAVPSAWVSVIDFKMEDGKYWPYVNGEREDEFFYTKADAMLHYALKDNEHRTQYDEMQLQEIAYGSELDLTEYLVFMGEETRLDKLVSQVAPDVTEDEPPEVDEVGEPVSKLGEVYTLGRHRLMCGDSTKIEDVEKLMNGNKADMVFTDPPYGMDLDTDYSSLNSNPEFVAEKHLKSMQGNTYSKVIGDDKPFNYQDYAWLDSAEQFWWGGDYYAKTLPEGGSWFVWDKRNENEQLDKMFGSQFELCWSKSRHKREIARIQWAGVFGTKKEFDHKRHHPTQKPIALSSWFIGKFSQPEQKIIDLFGGSGSTLIACEQLDRTCYMMEIDPKYCDVIRKRYAKFVGKEDDWRSVTPAEKVDVEV
jgi:DNA modification methylase